MRRTLIAAALCLAGLAGCDSAGGARQQPNWDQSTPEAAVQAYFAHDDQEDVAVERALLDPGDLFSPWRRAEQDSIRESWAQRRSTRSEIRRVIGVQREPGAVTARVWALDYRYLSREGDFGADSVMVWVVLGDGKWQVDRIYSRCAWCEGSKVYLGKQCDRCAGFGWSPD